MIRTSINAHDLTSAGVVNGYKNLANIERDFRSIKSDDFEVRPVHHRLTDRVKATYWSPCWPATWRGIYVKPGHR